MKQTKRTVFSCVSKDVIPEQDNVFMHDLDCSNDTSLEQALKEPVLLTDDMSRSGVQLKVDTVHRIGGSVVVAGWCSNSDVHFAIEQNDRDLLATCLRFERFDVTQALGQATDEHSGFAAIVDLAPHGPLVLRVTHKGDAYSVPLEKFEHATALHQPNVLTAVATSLTGMTVASPEWSARLALLGEAQFDPDQLSGFVDHAYMTDAGGVVSGWALARRNVQAWIEDDTGRAYSLDDAFRWWRQDVAETNGSISNSGRKTGFLRALRASRGAKSFRLGGCSTRGRLFVPETAVTRVRTDVRSMGQALIDINTPRFDLVKRANEIDIPVLARIHRAEQTEQGYSQPTVRTYGSPPETPKTSIIIPLYERYDMMELQLLEFVGDSDFASDCEVIYVNDDPRHAQTLIGMAHPLHEITGASFRTVCSGVNLGFSKANNLGARYARGDTLIFMNSDVFPNHTGWTAMLEHELAQNAEFGIIAPRLVFPNGSLQHIGMEPVWRDSYQLWTNRHPMMGFDASYDTAETLQAVPLVSGACVAMRAHDFDKVGGWSTNYLIGDFEDSDLCLTLAHNGLKSGYLPTASLTHLERQSMVGIGTDSFRERVTLLNAALYNKRWFKALQRMSA